MTFNIENPKDSTKKIKISKLSLTRSQDEMSVPTNELYFSIQRPHTIGNWNEKAPFAIALKIK